jgi:hypothetical protein
MSKSSPDLLDCTGVARQPSSRLGPDSSRRLRRPTVGFDESGNTGPDLLNEQQPIFVLVSVGLEEDNASSILGAPSGSEHHSISTRRSPAGRERVLKVLATAELAPDTVKIAVMHKPFVVTSKFVDLIVEPVAARLGLDLYRQGAHLALSNLLYGAWPAIDATGAHQVWTSFVDWARKPDGKTATALSVAIRHMSVHVPDGLDLMLEVAAARLAEAPTDFAGAGDISDLDPAGPALVALLHDWSAQLGAFDVVHDDSAEIRRWLPQLDRLTNPDHTPVEVQLWNGARLRYPLPVGHITLGKSELSAQVQLADLIAGAATIGFGSLVRSLRGSRAEFAQAIMGSRLSEWVIDASIWPTTKLSPEELGAQPGDTPWIIDRLTGE